MFHFVFHSLPISEILDFFFLILEIFCEHIFSWYNCANLNFPCSSAIQVNAGGNKPKEVPSYFEKKSSSSYLIRLCCCSLCLQLAWLDDLHTWMTCVTAAPGFALPVEVGCFILPKIVQECPEESLLLLRCSVFVWVLDVEQSDPS